MLKCSTCNNGQDSGKFCSICGGKLVEYERQMPPDKQILDEQAATTQPDLDPSTPYVKQPSQANAFDIVEEMNQYGAFLLNLLKNPTKALYLNENSVLYGIINLSLYVITFALSIYLLLQTIFKNTVGFFSRFGMFNNIFDTTSYLPSSLPVSIIFQTGFRGILFIAIAFLSAFVFSKLMTNRLTFQQLIAQYGGILSPLLAVNTLAILLGVLGSTSLTLTLIIISFTLTIIIIPGLIVFEKSSQPIFPTQKVYVSFSASLVSFFGSYLVIKSGFSSFFMDFTNLIHFFSYF